MPEEIKIKSEPEFVVTETVIAPVPAGESIDQKPEPAPITKRPAFRSNSYNYTSGGLTTDSGRFRKG